MNYKFGVYGDSIAFGYGNNNQSWFDENKWGFNADVETFNQKLVELCEKHQIKYLDAYTSFCSLDLSKIYIDAIHLNKVGQQELAKIYRKIV